MQNAHTRLFKVAARSKNANSFGLYGHVLVAKDGEAWEVGRSVGPWNDDWREGTIVGVPVSPDDACEPQWHRVSCEIPNKLDDAPPGVVAEVWGD